MNKKTEYELLYKNVWKHAKYIKRRLESSYVLVITEDNKEFKFRLDSKIYVSRIRKKFAKKLTQLDTLYIDDEEVRIIKVEIVNEKAYFYSIFNKNSISNLDCDSCYINDCIFLFDSFLHIQSEKEYMWKIIDSSYIFSSKIDEFYEKFLI